MTLGTVISIISLNSNGKLYQLTDWLIFQILLQLEKHEIQIYNFPVSEMDPEHHWMRERMPFAVVGSNITITDQSTGQMYRGREYPWGCVNIEDKVSLRQSPSVSVSLC